MGAFPVLFERRPLRVFLGAAAPGWLVGCGRFGWRWEGNGVGEGLDWCCCGESRSWPVCCMIKDRLNVGFEEVEETSR